jgi:hypothetical protein
VLPSSTVVVVRKGKIPGVCLLMISEDGMVPKPLVEEAGTAFPAGYIGKQSRIFKRNRGTQTVGGRSVDWEFARGGVTVSHLPAGGGPPIRYTVPFVTTGLPSGGDRPWWSCPGCGRRCDDLFLVAGRDRLACRRCCGLVYRSQRTRGRVKARKPRPVLCVVRTRRQWTPLTGWVVLSRTERTR